MPAERNGSSISHSASVRLDSYSRPFIGSAAAGFVGAASTHSIRSPFRTQRQIGIAAIDGLSLTSVRVLRYIYLRTNTKRKTKMHTKDETQLQRYADRYRKLKTKLEELGFVLVGSLQSRRGECGKPACRCHANPAHRHGPYWYWTRKVNAKTVSVTLSTVQASRFAKWIQNGRDLERILHEMRKVSAQAAALVTGLAHSRIAYSAKTRAGR